MQKSHDAMVSGGAYTILSGVTAQEGSLQRVVGEGGMGLWDKCHRLRGGIFKKHTKKRI